MKTIFIKDDRLREILVDRNKKIGKLLSDGKLKGSLDIKLSTKEIRGKIFFGWKIIDLENMRRETDKEKPKPTGTITPLVDWFKPIDQLGE